MFIENLIRIRGAHERSPKGTELEFLIILDFWELYEHTKGFLAKVNGQFCWNDGKPPNNEICLRKWFKIFQKISPTNVCEGLPLARTLV